MADVPFNSRRIVEGERLRRRAASRTLSSCTLSTWIFSCSPSDRYRPEGGDRLIDRMPPACLDQSIPTTGDTPQAAAALSVDNPVATPTQKRRSNSRLKPGRPGERISGLPVCATPNPPAYPRNTSILAGVPTTIESALHSKVDVHFPFWSSDGSLL